MKRSATRRSISLVPELFGKGNYCIAGHSSIIYKEFFSDLKYIENGMEIYLYDKEKVCYTYC